MPPAWSWQFVTGTLLFSGLRNVRSCSGRGEGSHGGGGGKCTQSPTARWEDGGLNLACRSTLALAFRGVRFVTSTRSHSHRSTHRWGPRHCEPVLGGAGFLPDACPVCRHRKGAWTPAVAPGCPYKISVNVSSVVLHATVEITRALRFRGRQGDFRYTRTAPVAIELNSIVIEDIPVTVGWFWTTVGAWGRGGRGYCRAHALPARAIRKPDVLSSISMSTFHFGLPATHAFHDQTAEFEACPVEI